MKIQATIDRSEIEEVCRYDEWEQDIICDDLDTVIETTPEYVEFEDGDIEQIVAMYFDSVLGIILSNKEYREKLMRKLGCRKYEEEGEEDI